ncbi:MAG: hypothetical protein QF898_07815 [SAR202 cluster bacterium]|jgi:hypothetical protein|nr:hypothetical protein [SAR202 cluster bacterium]MDP6513864.1 hypothetical protein [SAR202 cluster bacterium]MDP6715181.1 hypothetical protein [SAR202 cluster bacterium]
MAKRTVIYFEVEPELRNRCKAAAALSGTTLKQWAMDALKEKLESELAVPKITDNAIVIESKGSLEDTLELVEKLSPSIKEGILKVTDPTDDLEILRSERMDDFGG